MAEPEVTRDEAGERYELRAGDKVVGFLRYRETDGRLTLLHTEVDPPRRERGLGSALVGGALDDARARGLEVVPVCPFVTDFLERNREYADLVASE